MRTYKYSLPSIAPHEAFRVFADQPYSILLDNHVIAFDPIETFEFKAIAPDSSPFEHLQSMLDKYTPENTNDYHYFTGGLAGLFSYDLGRSTEELPSTTKDELNLPDIVVGLYLKVLVFEGETNTLSAFITAQDQEAADSEFEAINLQSNKIEYLQYELNWQADKDKDNYRADIQKTIDYINAGDIFQACIAQRWTAELPTDFNAYAHYEHLREISPAPYACYMNISDAIISSNSPERFLQIDQDGNVETCPIKGTAQIDTDPAFLLSSEKDRAENTMIVDLMRNDLSRTCKASSVKVPELCELKSFANVHHLVSKVTAKLKEEHTAVDLLRTCFPGGSISGAPKIRAMAIIDEIEPVRRHAYCGSIGTIGFNGTMNMNILIRTLIFKNGKAHLYSGGGIIADSEPESEYQETLAKAQKLFESFEDTP